MVLGDWNFFLQYLCWKLGTALVSCSLLVLNTLEYLVMTFLLQAVTNAADCCLHMVVSDSAEMCMWSRSRSPSQVSLKYFSYVRKHVSTVTAV